MEMLGLSDAILLQIANNVTTARDLNAFLQTSSRLSGLLQSLLDRKYGQPGFGEETNGLLHKAARKGRDRAVSRLLNFGHSLEARGADQMTALLCAVEAGALSTANLLLGKGADRFATASRGETALHLAARGGHLAIITILITKGLRVNTPDKFGSTPLHYAATEGHAKAVSFLVDFDADVGARGWLYRTPLHCAVIGGHPEAAEELIRGGADVLAESLDRGGCYMPLHAAVEHGHTAIVKLLVKAGGDIEKRFNGYQGCELAPIHLAVYMKHSDMVKILLELGADPASTTAVGLTTVHCAAVGANKEIAELLLNRKPGLLESRDKHGRMPLMLAIGVKNEGVYEYLLDKGADITAEDDSGRTARYWVEYAAPASEDILCDLSACTQENSWCHWL